MVQSSNPLSVAVAAVRGFWVVGKTPAAPRLFLSHPALDSQQAEGRLDAATDHTEG